MTTTTPPVRLSTGAAYPAALSGIAAFSVMDAVMKGLTLELGAYNAMVWRSWIALAIMTPLYFATRKRWPDPRAMKLHMLRGSISAVMAFTFFWGIARVPLAEGIALSFVAPLIAIYLSAVFLHEKVQQGAILASLISLSGVVVIAAARATGDFSDDAVWGLASIMVSAILYAANITMMRAQAQAAGPIEITFFQNLVASAQLGLLAPFLLETPTLDTLVRMSGASLLTVYALFILAWAYARGQTQHLVSTEYTAFIWASLFGWWFFAEEVTLTTLAGCALIVTGCLMATRNKE